ncbi:LysR family transcriptional regulator [Alcaligenes sp. 13f]|uniref:LysR family transcriptional regulator n=1 Tax=Alcaligenes sp. 13f TaxID=2841924 RepID=UPI001CF6FE0E|nr:LysR family transcriptional regulator [Alcaligenes sp. 13f]MCB4322597.1 LysR family transcriptional regulator [Alcaligenes sp. 13f]
MTKITILHLQTLCRIAQQGSFQAAADYMHTTQPTVSARMREFEDRIGFPVFHKRGRRMDLTTQGRELVQQIKPLLAAIDDVIYSLDDASHASGLICVGIAGLIGQTWFSTFIKTARATMPQLSFEVEVGQTSLSVSKLENGQLDLVFLATHSLHMDHRFHVEPIGVADVLLVGAPELVGRNGKQSDKNWLQILQSQPVWSLSKESPLHPILMKLIKDYNLKVKVDICSNILTLKELICRGTGVGLMTAPLIESELERGELVVLKEAPAFAPIPFNAAWGMDQSQTVIRKLVDIAKAVSTFR